MPVSDHRTQIYLPNNLYTLVKQQANHQGISMAQVIREALQEKVVQKRKKKKNEDHNSIMQLAGTIKGEPADFSKNISKYIKQMYMNKKP